MDIRSRQPSGRVPDRPRKPRHLGKAAGTREGIAGRPDRPFDGYPCLGSLALASGPDPADEQTLALVGVCVNRIGKGVTSNYDAQPDNRQYFAWNVSDLPGSNLFIFWALFLNAANRVAKESRGGVQVA